MTALITQWALDFYISSKVRHEKWLKYFLLLCFLPTLTKATLHARLSTERKRNFLLDTSSLFFLVDWWMKMKIYEEISSLKFSTTISLNMIRRNNERMSVCVTRQYFFRRASEHVCEERDSLQYHVCLPAEKKEIFQVFCQQLQRKLFCFFILLHLAFHCRHTTCI